MITRKTQGDFVKLLSDSFAFDVSDSDLLLRAVLKKGHVVFLHSTTTKSSIMETAKKILSITSQDPACNKHLSGLRSSVIRLMKRVKVFQKSLTRSWKLMVEFLNEEFLLPTPSISALKAQSHQNVPSSDPVATTSSLFLHPAVLPSKKLKTDFNLTLAWDATSLDAQHVNEVHIHTSPSLSSGYVLQVSNLPGGTTEDYTEHIKNCISDVVQTYALFNGEDELVTKGKVISHLKNILSDRVAVNHCVVQKIQDDFHIELLELKCNVHPLDGIAHKCRSNLKKYDTEHNIKGDIFGSDCCAANLIYCMAFQR